MKLSFFKSRRKHELTGSQKLDLILSELYINHENRNDRMLSASKYIFEMMMDKLVGDKKTVDFFFKILESKGQIKRGVSDNDIPTITDEGIRFFLSGTGGHSTQQYNLDIDRKIKEETLNKFRRDKWAFGLSIIAILFSLLNLFILLVEKQDLLKKWLSELGK
jgi:hypothetical protein